MLSFTRTEPLLAEKKFPVTGRKINSNITNKLVRIMRYILYNFLNIKLKLHFMCLPSYGRPPPSKAGQKKARPVMFHMMPSHCDVLAYHAILSQEAQ